MKTLTYILIFALVLVGTMSMCQTGINWQKVDEGLFFCDYQSPMKSSFGNSKIAILKIDPRYYQFNLFSAKEPDEKMLNVQEWADAKGQIAVINAGMFQGDYATNCGYMKDYDFINNPYMNDGYKAILAFNPKDNSVPPVQIIDQLVQNWDTLKTKYNCYTQCIRMVTTAQRNCWIKQNAMWSMSIVAIDKKGNVLFIMSRSPYLVHDLIDILLDAPLGIYNMMYLEGGESASLYMNYNGSFVCRMGSYETRLHMDDSNNQLWKMPNVIGISKR